MSLISQPPVHIFGKTQMWGCWGSRGWYPSVIDRIKTLDASTHYILGRPRPTPWLGLVGRGWSTSVLTWCRSSGTSLATGCWRRPNAVDGHCPWSIRRLCTCLFSNASWLLMFLYVLASLQTLRTSFAEIKRSFQQHPFGPTIILAILLENRLPFNIFWLSVKWAHSRFVKIFWKISSTIA